MSARWEKIKVEMMLNGSTDGMDAVGLAQDFARCLESDNITRCIDDVRSAIAAARQRTMPAEQAQKGDRDRLRGELRSQIVALEQRLRELDAA